MLGSWDIKVSTSGMPQKIASAVSDIELVGASYIPIAYLGSQVVNGVNHAILAEQTIISSQNRKNIVIMIFNESVDGTVSLISIDRVMEGGAPLGGLQICPTVNIPAEAMDAFNDSVTELLGVAIKPFALLGTKVTKNTNFVFAATCTPIVENPQAKLTLIVVNSETKDVIFYNLLADKLHALGYSFTW